LIWINNTIGDLGSVQVCDGCAPSVFFRSWTRAAHTEPFANQSEACDFQPEILESRTIGAAILAADVCGSCPTVTAGLNVKRQRFADPEVIRIDARVFQCKNVQKGIGTTRVISDKSEPAIGYPFF
jgi:hypothetical protein